MEKIIERSASAYTPSRPPAREPETDYRREERRPERDWEERGQDERGGDRREERRPERDWEERGRDEADWDARRERPPERAVYRQEDSAYRHDKPKKRGGFLSDLFEFGD